MATPENTKPSKKNHETEAFEGFLGIRSAFGKQVEELHREKRDLISKLQKETKLRKSLEKRLKNLESRSKWNLLYLKERWKEGVKLTKEEEDNLQQLSDTIAHLKSQLKAKKAYILSMNDKYWNLQLSYKKERWNADELKAILNENSRLRTTIDVINQKLKDHDEESQMLLDQQQTDTKRLYATLDRLKIQLSEAQQRKSEELEEAKKHLEKTTARDLEQYKEKCLAELNRLRKEQQEQEDMIAQVQAQALEHFKARTKELDKLKRRQTEEIAQMDEIYKREVQELKNYCEKELEGLQSTYALERERLKKKVSRMEEKRHNAMELLTKHFEAEAVKMQEDTVAILATMKAQFDKESAKYRGIDSKIKELEEKLAFARKSHSQKYLQEMMHKVEASKKIHQEELAKLQEQYTIVKAQRDQVEAQIAPQKESLFMEKKEITSVFQEVQKLAEAEVAERQRLVQSESDLLKEIESMKEMLVTQVKAREALEKHTDDLHDNVKLIQEEIKSQVAMEHQKLQQVLEKKLKIIEEEKEKELKAQLEKEQQQMQQRTKQKWFKQVSAAMRKKKLLSKGYVLPPEELKLSEQLVTAVEGVQVSGEVTAEKVSHESPRKLTLSVSSFT